MTHTHTFSTEEFYIRESLATTTVLACPCGAIASVGEGESRVIWQPENGLKQVGDFRKAVA